MIAPEPKHRVAVVLDPDFGDRLYPLAERIDTWVCDSEPNRRAAAIICERCKADSLESRVTTFKCSVGEQRESSLLRILDTVDDHHGEYSRDPPWTALEIYGAAPTSAVRDKLSEYGVVSFEATVFGFECSRSDPKRAA